MATYEEGCLSIPEYLRARWSARRQVKVKYLDLEGKAHEVEANGLLATCLQHEIDHLDGVLFIDHHLQAQARPRHQEIRQGRQAAAQAG